MINTSNSGMCSDCCALIKIEDHTEILWGPHVNLFSHDQDIDRISVNRIRSIKSIQKIRKSMKKEQDDNVKHYR